MVTRALQTSDHRKNKSQTGECTKHSASTGSQTNRLQCKCIRLAAAVAPFDVLSKTREVTKDEIRAPSALAEDRLTDRDLAIILHMHARRQAVTARLNFKSLETKTTVSKRTHADAHEQ